MKSWKTSTQQDLTQCLELDVLSSIRYMKKLFGKTQYMYYELMGKSRYIPSPMKSWKTSTQQDLSQCLELDVLSSIRYMKKLFGKTQYMYYELMGKSRYIPSPMKSWKTSTQQDLSQCLELDVLSSIRYMKKLFGKTQYMYYELMGKSRYIPCPMKSWKTSKQQDLCH